MGDQAGPCVYTVKRPCDTAAAPHDHLTVNREAGAMLRLAVFLVLASFASCCQKKNDIMTCEMIPESSERMEAVRILIVDRVFGEMLDLRSFELAKIMIKFPKLTCGSVLVRRDTQVFLGDKMCPIVSKFFLPSFFLIYVHLLFKMNIKPYLISNCLCLSGFGRVAPDIGRVQHDDPRGNGSDNLQ